MKPAPRKAASSSSKPAQWRTRRRSHPLVHPNGIKLQEGQEVLGDRTRLILAVEFDMSHERTRQPAWRRWRSATALGARAAPAGALGAPATQR